MQLSNFRRLFYLHMSIIISLSVGLIWVRTATVRETYRFVQSEKNMVQTKQEIQALRIKWTKLTAPQKLIQAAKEFNLLPPKIGQTLKHTSPKI